jgi:hypothetical protein
MSKGKSLKERHAEAQKAKAEKKEPEMPETGADVLQKIEIRFKGSITTQVSELYEIQGDFKELSPMNERRLRGELLRLGICEPFTVCEREAGGYYLLNGHQRFKVLKGLMKDGAMEATVDLPCNVVEVDDEKQAVQICLALTSQYGTVTRKGLSTMAKKAKLDIDDLQDRFNFPDLDLADLKKEIENEGEEKPKKKPKKEGDGDRVKKVKCPKCKHQFEVRA